MVDEVWTYTPRVRVDGNNQRRVDVSLSVRDYIPPPQTSGVVQGPQKNCQGDLEFLFCNQRSFIH